MDIEKSYFAISWFFNIWVRLVEYQTRKMEVADSAGLGPARLVISPPTDAGIPILVRANASGETGILCFSERLEGIAEEFCRKHGVTGFKTHVKPFFAIPAPDRSLSAIYANCLFDYCASESIDATCREMWRALVPGGVLFAVNMAPPLNRVGRYWAWTFAHLPGASNGCRPVSVAANLAQAGFKPIRMEALTRLGFPLHYLVFQKPTADPQRPPQAIGNPGFFRAGNGPVNDPEAP